MPEIELVRQRRARRVPRRAGALLVTVVSAAALVALALVAVPVVQTPEPPVAVIMPVSPRVLAGEPAGSEDRSRTSSRGRQLSEVLTPAEQLLIVGLSGAAPGLASAADEVFGTTVGLLDVVGRADPAG